MGTAKIAEEINRPRRYFVGAAAVTAAAARFGMIGSADAQPSKANPADVPPIRPGTNTSFGPLKQINAGVLNVGYAEAGPANGPPVILLHGWPYDIYSYVDVAPLLASAGYRVIVPYLRGYGTTRFLSSDTARNGQQSVVAVDAIALMDALKIEKAILGGFDWGARTVNIMAALWPERCKAMVSVSGYLIGNQESGKMPLPPGRGAPMVVPILLCHRARPGWLRQIPARLLEAHLADRFAEVELRRRHVRSHRGVLRQPGSCRHRDSQLPLAARSRARRA
jgi:pimeloyl-ACP methyl ester carboxylesterase